MRVGRVAEVIAGEGPMAGPLTWVAGMDGCWVLATTLPVRSTGMLRMSCSLPLMRSGQRFHDVVADVLTEVPVHARDQPVQVRVHRLDQLRLRPWPLLWKEPRQPGAPARLFHRGRPFALGSQRDAELGVVEPRRVGA